jgi:hypothetical protein
MRVFYQKPGAKAIEYGIGGLININGINGIRIDQHLIEKNPDLFRTDPLFVTNDGIKIYPGDTYYLFCDKDVTVHHRVKDKLVDIEAFKILDASFDRYQDNMTFDDHVHLFSNYPAAVKAIELDYTKHPIKDAKVLNGDSVYRVSKDLDIYYPLVQVKYDHGNMSDNHYYFISEERAHQWIIDEGERRLKEYRKAFDEFLLLSAGAIKAKSIKMYNTLFLKFVADCINGPDTNIVLKKIKHYFLTQIDNDTWTVERLDNIPFDAISFKSVREARIMFHVFRSAKDKLILK